jgi:transposase
MPWRDLPERYGDWKAVRTCFIRWVKAGVWERLFKHLAEDADNEYTMTDSTIARAHRRSAGAPTGRRPTDPSQRLKEAEVSRAQGTN